MSASRRFAAVGSGEARKGAKNRLFTQRAPERQGEADEVVILRSFHSDGEVLTAHTKSANYKNEFMSFPVY